MGFETQKIGLGEVANRNIAEYLNAGNYDGLLQIINSQTDKRTACEVVLKSMFEFNQGSRSESVDNVLKTAFKNIDTYGEALKELVLYAYKNNLRGERFFKNPTKNETLFVDDDGELISFQGEIDTFSQGESKGMNYIKSLSKYQVLTGHNAGKSFDGSYAAEQRKDPLYRPIKGPAMN